MNSLPFTRTALATALAVTFFCAASTAATPVSPEFQVNTFTAGDQEGTAIAMDADGDFVVSWHSYQDGSEYGVYAQRYNAAGTAVGGEFRVNTRTRGFQGSPSVAMDARGDFVISWIDIYQYAESLNIYARRYNADGIAQGSPFAVNTSTFGNQDDPKVAMDANGDFVVTWISNHDGSPNSGIYAQRYNAAGVAQGGEFRVSGDTANNRVRPSVAMDAAGDFAVTWDSRGQDGSGYGIYARRYNAAGVAQGSEFRVNTFTTDDQDDGTVAMDAAGNFVVSWTSSSQDGSSAGVYAQRYNAAGVRQGSEFRVNTTTRGVQVLGGVAIDANGDFIISWTTSTDEYPARQEVYAQRYNAAGIAQGGEFHVNSQTSDDQIATSVATDADGDFVIGWQSYGQDGSGNGVYARRYQGPEAVDLTLSQFDSADPVAAGTALAYTLSAANLHPSSSTAIGAASAVRIISTLPTGASFVSSSGTGWSCSLALPTLTCGQADTLAGGNSAPPLTINLTAPNASGTIQLDASVSASQLDPVPSNNRDIETTQIGGCAPSVIQFSAASFSASESAPTMTVMATRSGGGCGVSTVRYDTASGSAVTGNDFIDAGGPLSWADGELGSKSFTVSLFDDSLDEINEKFPITLSSPQNAQLGARARTSGIITDNDPTPRVSFTATAQTAAEPDAQASITLQLSAISGRDVVVPITRSGSATSGSDYRLDETAFTIPAGQRSVSFSVQVLADAESEPTETAVFGIGTPTGSVAGKPKTYTLSITNHDAPLPTVSFSAGR